MNFDKIHKILSDCKDYHLPACIFMFVVGTVVHWLHGIDAAYVSFVAVLVGGITGHAFSPGQHNGDGDTHTGTDGAKG